MKIPELPKRTKKFLLGAAIAFGGIWISAILGSFTDSLGTGAAAFLTGFLSLVIGVVIFIEGLE